MGRRRHEEEHENHERWLVSYADFITLLFAFFVVMYSISSVNEGKYRVLSDSLIDAFKEPTRSLNPIQTGETLRSIQLNRDAVNPPSGIEHGIQEPVEEEFEHTPGEGGGKEQEQQQEKADQATDETAERERQQRLAQLDEIAGDLEEKLSPLIDQKLIKVKRKDNWVEVEMKTNILFDSGSARLAVGAIPILKELGEVFKNFGNPIQVEGFTDNRPINTPAFPSNWELSAARAASVVHLFQRLGVDPERMAAIGYGEYHPVASNDTPEGRAQNRRVVIIIAADSDTRRIVDLTRATQARRQSAGTEGGP
ncbi:MAG: flagellar motor protein MotD [Gammaproteobacteria bacterium]|nr:MAG: flagellar motor protein MotD [Gammaproteobacteria bacterium]